MSFENIQVASQTLPRVEDLVYEPLQIAYRKAMYVGAGIFSFFLLIPVVILLTAFERWDRIEIAGSLILLWLLIVVLNFIFVNKKYQRKSYAIRDRDIIYNSGLLIHHATTVPFNRIQHCDIKQGVIGRYFGISRLNIYTAGGSSSDLSIPGLLPRDAQSIMNYIMGKTVILGDEEE